MCTVWHRWCLRSHQNIIMSRENPSKSAGHNRSVWPHVAGHFVLSTLPPPPPVQPLTLTISSSNSNFDVSLSVCMSTSLPLPSSPFSTHWQAKFDTREDHMASKQMSDPHNMTMSSSDDSLMWAPTTSHMTITWPGMWSMHAVCFPLCRGTKLESIVEGGGAVFDEEIKVKQCSVRTLLLLYPCET